MATKKITEIDIAEVIDNAISNFYVETDGVFQRANVEIVSHAIKEVLKLDSSYVTVKKMEEMYPDLVKTIERSADESGNEGFRVIYWDENEEFIPASSSGGGQSFDSGYQDEDGFIHLTKNGEDIEGFDPFKIAGGGGGSAGGSKITFACYTSPAFSVMDTAGTAPIRFKFLSIDTETGIATGSGNLAISVGGIIKANITVQQGDNLQVDVFQYLNIGANTVKLTITDSYGATASRNFTVTKEKFGLEWSLGDTNKNTESTLSFYLTPTGSGTKTIYTYVDGSLYSTDSVASSGRRLTKTISGLSHGMHTIEVYGLMDVGGVELESEHLVAAVAQISSGSTVPVVAVKWPSGELAQYTNTKVAYMVIDPQNNPSEVQTFVNGVLQSTESCDQSEYIWSYRPVISGTVTLGIKCGSTMVEKEFTIGSIGAEVEEITDALGIKVDPSVISDLKTWRYGEYSFGLSEHFDLTNGGLQIDEDGIHCIRITAGDRLTLNYPLFSGDARKTGKAFKVIYKIKDSSNKETVGISCMSGGIGLEIRANNAYISGDQTTIKMSTCEDERTELDFNIQQDSADRLLQIWEGCSTFTYNQYASSESFTHSTDQGIVFGSDDADVILYLFRAYNRDLTDNELKANFIFDGASGTEIISRQSRNDIYDGTGKIDVETAAAKNPNAHFLIVNAPRMTVGKKDTVSGSINHIYVAGGAEHRFSARMEMVVQGTSSVEHAETAGPNLKIKLKWGIDLEDGTHKDGYAIHGEENSIPITVLNFKKNIASEDHIVNMMCAEWYNRYQPTIRPERVEDPRVRDCLDADMCVVFYHNTSDTQVQVGPDLVQPDETIFFGLGNLCTDKDAVEAFRYEPIVIEVKNNTEPQVRFKSDDLSNFDTNFEFRYLDTEQFTEEEAKAKFQELATFICSCDYTQATNTALEKVVSINGQAFSYDTAEYRKAKWKAEAPERLDMPGLYWHHNDTLFHLLRDNRAKNMFWSYDPITGKWSLKFNWDNDTGHCRNNEGYIDIEPGYLDTDTFGTADVFNAADNVVFQNVRECNWDELRAAYIDRESAGAWDINAIYAFIKQKQNSICEALWIEDAQHNAIRTMQNLGTTAYLERATGKLQLHLKKSLTFQKALVDSYYNATASTSDSASFRGYTPSSWAGVEPSGKLKITPYTNMFINILAGSTEYRQRAYAGQEIEIDISAELNDTEIYLRDARWIMSLGSMAGMYLGQFEASKLRRVKRFLIGSDVEGYYNTNFTTASFDNCKKLEEVNMGGLVNAKKAFDFSPNIYLRKIYTKGSGVTGITFAKNGRLNEARLNAVASLFMSGLRLMEVFEMESYDSLTSVTVEDSPAVDTYSLAKAATNLARVRLLEIDWSVPTTAYEVLMRLHSIHGIDDDGYDTDAGVLTGAVFFSSISASRFASIVEAIPEVEFTYGDYLEEFTARFQNDDGTEFPEATQSVERGGKAIDPVAAGMIQKPTKAPSIDYTYEFYGWDMSLDYIIQDTVFTAVYKEIPRVNTVVFKDFDGSVLQTDQVDARGSVSYRGADLVRDGYIWTGWDQQTNNVTEDMVVTATYEYPTLPPAVLDVNNFDYVYSDDPNDSSAYTFGQLYAIIKTGQTSRYIPVKGKIKMVPLKNTYIADESIVFNLHSVGHYELADGSGAMSNADFYMTGVLNAGRRLNPTNTNEGGWDACEGRKWLNETIFPNVFPPHWRSLIVKTKTLASAGNQSATILTSEDYLRIPAYAEVGFGTNEVPYKNEISEKAAEKTFSQYVDNASRIKKTFNNEGTAQGWWLRSPWSSSSTTFAGVYNNGGGSYGNGVTIAYFWCVGFSA